MAQTNHSRRLTARSVLIMGCLLGAGFLLGSFTRPTGDLQAEVTKSPPREAFLSGGARSEKVLVEISETLKKIEQQVGRIEASMSHKPK